MHGVQAYENYVFRLRVVKDAIALSEKGSVASHCISRKHPLPHRGKIYFPVAWDCYIGNSHESRNSMARGNSEIRPRSVISPVMTRSSVPCAIRSLPRESSFSREMCLLSVDLKDGTFHTVYK